MSGAIFKYFLSGSSRSQPKPCNYMGSGGAAVCSSAGSEVEVHAGGHGTVLNSRVHDACQARGYDQSPNKGREVPEN